MRKIIQLIKNKALPVLGGLTLSLALSLAFVSWQYVGSLETISSLRGDNRTLEQNIQTCNSQLILANENATDLQSTGEKTAEELSQSRNEFHSLKEEMKNLTTRRCHNETTSQYTEDPNRDVGVDDYYRLYFRAYCLSTGSGSCDSP